MLKLLLYFHRTLSAVNLPLSLLAGVLGMLFSPNKAAGFINGFSLLLLTGGFLMAYYSFELRISHLYYFYHNRNISKIQLYGFSYALNLLLAILLFLLKVKLYA